MWIYLQVMWFLAYGCREDARYPNTAALGLHILIFIDALLQQKVELPKRGPRVLKRPKP